jgi:hypothetical protein
MSFIPEEKGFWGRVGSSVRNAVVPPPDPKEAVKNWTKQIRVEARNVDKSIRGARQLAPVMFALSRVTCAHQHLKY